MREREMRGGGSVREREMNEWSREATRERGNERERERERESREREAQRERERERERDRDRERERESGKVHGKMDPTHYNVY